MSTHQTDSMPLSDDKSQRFIDLIHRDIDQELSLVEQNELTTALAESKAARVLQVEMQKLVAQLNEVPEREPPANLNSLIIGNIHRPRIEAKAADKLDASGFFTSLREAISPRAGFAAATLAVLMLGIYQFGSETAPQTDPNRLAGSMLPDNQQGRIIDSINIVNDKMTAVAELRHQQDFYVLDLRVKAEAPFEVALQLDGTGLEYQQLENKSDWISTQNGQAIVSGKADLHYEFILDRSKQQSGPNYQPLKLVFSSENKVIQTAEMNTMAMTR